MNLAPLLCAILLSAPSDHEIDFDSQIMPILTKAGCTAGACHGAAAGRGGFTLSLLGSDPASDYQAIVHQFEGRRVNLAKPDQSLLLAKPTGYLEHGGELVFDTESEEATRLIAWITAGAPRGKQRKLTRFEISPQRRVVELGQDPIPLRATAYFDDGPGEDVTGDVLFTSTDTAAVDINSRGPTASLRRSGQQIVIARYLDRVAPIEFLVPYSGSKSQLDYPTAKNFIDEEIFGTLKTLRVPVSRPATDSEFLRRVSLDLTGLLPPLELATSFPSDASPDKREKLVDSLLSSEQFADYWTLRFARLQLHSLPNDKICSETYAQWLKKQLRSNAPLNETAAALLTATGDSHTVGPANFARMINDPRSHAELVGKVFMGVRLGCANCHNHPLDRWTQDDFHGFAAVFAKLDRGPEVKLTKFGAVTNLRTGELATPRIPGLRFLVGDEDPRIEAAQFLTASGDRQFARAIVNRLWQAMMGRGLVEPIDDMRDTNPATHPELLTRLSDDLALHNYDLRHALRHIVLSNTYALSQATSAQNRADDRFYSHAYSKPLLPEVLADAVTDIIGAKMAPMARAISIVDPLEPAPTLDILGRCDRAGGCEEDAARSLGLAAQLHILNGGFINEKFESNDSHLGRRLAEGKSNAEIVREFYLRGLSREPNDIELKNWTNRLHELDEVERRDSLEDFVWSLLSSSAFTENH